MARALIFTVAFALMLAACGQVISITLPGGPPVPAPAGTIAPVIARLPPLPGGYERLYTVTPYGFRASGPGEPVRRGAASERFELRLGDCDGSDCTDGRGRAEIREITPQTAARLNRDIWYGWSFLNVDIGSVSRATSPGAVFGQWKPEGAQPPAFRITQLATGEGKWATCDPTICSQLGSPNDDVVVELEDMRVALGWGDAQNKGAVCRLFNMQAMQGKWVDIVVNTNFATDNNGYLRIWVNGELRCNYLGALVSPPRGFGASSTLSHRRGILATNTTRFAAQKVGAAVPRMVVYYDEYLSGKTRADVDTRLREAMSEAAKD